MSEETKTYLGDGVYVELKAGAIFLYTEDGVRRTNAIYLEGDVWTKLLEWAGKLKITVTPGVLYSREGK